MEVQQNDSLTRGYPRIMAWFLCDGERCFAVRQEGAGREGSFQCNARGRPAARHPIPSLSINAVRAGQRTGSQKPCQWQGMPCTWRCPRRGTAAR